MIQWFNLNDELFAKPSLIRSNIKFQLKYFGGNEANAINLET